MRIVCLRVFPALGAHLDISFILCMTHGLYTNNALTWPTACYRLSRVYLENVIRLLFRCHNCPNFSFNLHMSAFLFFFSSSDAAQPGPLSPYS